MTETNSLVSNYLFTLLKTFSRIVFPIASFTYAARILGEDGIGRVSFSNSIVTFFTLLAVLGMNYYGTREAAKLRDDRDKLSKFVHEMLIINGSTTFMSYLLLAVSLCVMPKLWGYERIIIISSLSIVLQGLGMEWLYQALERYRYITIRTLIFQIVALAVMLVFVRTSDDMDAYAAVLMLASSGSFLLNFFHARKYVNFKYYSDYHIIKHLRPLLLLFAMVASIEIYTVLDHAMLGLLQGDVAVGRYEAAVKVNKTVVTLITTMGVVLIPRISYYIGNQNWEEIHALVIKAYNYTFLLCIPCTIGLFVLSDEIIRLFSGKSFAAAAVTMQILTPIVLVIPFSMATNQQTLIPMGKEKLMLIATCMGAVVNFACNMLLIPHYAENGAAIATVIAETTVALVSFKNVKRYINMGSSFRYVHHYLLAASPIFLFSWLAHLSPIPYKTRMTLIIAASIICYFFVLYLLRNEYCIKAVRLLKKKSALLLLEGMCKGGCIR